MDRISIILFACVALLVTCTTAATNDQDECIEGPSSWYRGTRSYTAKGTTCQRWDTDKPHKPKHVPKDGGHHNYCRNPDNDLRGTWCYTINNSTRWEYCNISKCPDDSLVIWTNYDATTESTHLLRVQADPEIVKQETDSTGSFNVTVLTGSNKSMTEYWALAADYNHKQLYFTDYRSEYIGVWKMDTKTSTRYFEGMAHGIECIAYDWMTGNLYWTDSEFKWVMAADKEFNHYAPVYRTSPDPAYGLAVHSMKRLLIFSTYKALGSKIMMTDLAGKNEKVLFSFPDVFDVTGITIDYTDDRIYWTDFTGYGGMVMSSRLDKSNKTQHHYRGGSIFWGVAAYLEYLYVSDVHARYSMTGSRFYSVWIITKRTKQVFRYTLSGKPRGVAVYSQNEEMSLDSAPTSGECGDTKKCAHLCLPRINATRVCGCSLGYHLQTDTNKCVTKLVNDDYLLVADAGQGKVFQIPIRNDNQNGTLDYSIVPLGHKWKTVTVAIDPASQYLYWSDKKSPSVNRAIMDGSRFSNIAKSYANSIIIDPHTGNIIYSDNDADSIMVAKGDGSESRTIVKPEPSTSNSTSIRMITQDIKFKYLYWTDTFSKEGEGKVMRCRMDGSGKEVVLDKLNWPHAITIDHKTTRLYVAEAKTAVIYELDLTKLVAISSTSASQSQFNKYDVSRHLTRISPYIIDLKIHEGMAYVVDGKSSRLERFNLTEGPKSMAPYGPAEFFRVTTVSVYSNTLYTKYIKTSNNPCNNNHCRSLCVAMSDTEHKCLCADGKKAYGPICIDDIGKDYTAPKYDKCPDNQEISLPTCSATVTFAWRAPKWTDDKTNTADMTYRKPLKESPARLTAGDHEFTYSATDRSGNSGYCRFTVKIKDNQCSPAPNTGNGMVKSELKCGTREGSSYNISCVDPSQVIWSNGRTYKSYYVYCSKELSWVHDLSSSSDCRAPPPTITPSSSTTSGTTRTTASTTQSTRSTVSTVSIPKSSATQKTASSTTTTKPTISSSTNSSLGGNNNVGAQKTSGGLSSGIAALIAIIVIVLIVVIVVIVFVTVRRNSPSLLKYSFPKFWKSKDDTVDLQKDKNNHYTVM